MPTDAELPPDQIKHRGLVLTRYDDCPVEAKGRLWWTYVIAGVIEDARIWAYCPATGEIVMAVEGPLP